jgi:hypothetical protein
MQYGDFGGMRMTAATLQALGISQEDISQGDLVSRSPVDGAVLGREGFSRVARRAGAAPR